MADLRRDTRTFISVSSGVWQLEGVEGSVRITLSVSSLVLGRYSLYIESCLQGGGVELEGGGE